MRTGNPALRGDIFRGLAASDNAMTVQGTVNKSLTLLLIAVLAAGWVWGAPGTRASIILPGAIIGFITALVTIFKREWSPYTAPIYALFEGFFLGGVSAVFEAAYPGIVIQAVTLTFGTLFCMLLAYKTGVIKVTEKFMLGVIAATGAIALVYFVSFILGMFGFKVFLIYGNGPAGILFSLFVVAIAALNLVLDFHFIEQGASGGAPDYMEWYGAFSIMVTLIWLYLEILRLLARTRR